MVTTKTRHRRLKVLDEINSLPTTSFLRQFLKKIDYKIIPVDNKITALAQVARLSVHQAVIGVDDNRDHKPYKIDKWKNNNPEYDDSNNLLSQLSLGSMILENGICNQKLERMPNKKVKIFIECEYDEP